MTNADITRMITLSTVLAVREQTGQGFVPVGVSNRHVHLSKADVVRLFGEGHRLTVKKELSQPGQFACEETVTLVGPKGEMKGVRVLGPERGDTQVELAVTDAVKLGVKPVVRMSGDIVGTPGIRMVGPAGSIELAKGVIIAARHLHCSPDQAKALGLQNGQNIRIRTGGERSVVLENVAVRCGSGHDLELHLDFDEANGALLTNGSIVEIVY